MQKVQRFEVWLINLNPTKGREINKTRPCVVVSPNEMSALSTAIVAPMTTKGFEFPSRVPYKFNDKKGLILLDQMRAIDKSRLINKIGFVDKETRALLCSTMQEMFSLV